MTLESLQIQRMTYGANKGKMEGAIKFENPQGNVQIMLDDETCHRILVLCADGLVTTAKAVALDLTAEIINSATKSLEAPHE